MISASAIRSLEERRARRETVPRILVGFDGSPPSRRALDHAAARVGVDGELHLVTIVPMSVRNSTLASMMPAGVELPPHLSLTFEETARRRLDEVLAQLAKSGHKAHGHVRAGESALMLLEMAKEIEAHEIVIGHKSYESGAALGPNANEIVRQAHVPVTVVP